MTLTGDAHHILPDSRSAAVTGAGSGLGRDIALGLAARSYRVFGTAFSMDEVADLKQASNGAVDLTVCDITSEAAIKNWVGHVETSAEGLDLLISNAGVLTPGPLEVLPLAAIRREFDVNVFGALGVINGFLPALRRNRGRIVQISTWTASLPLPFNGRRAHRKPPWRCLRPSTARSWNALASMSWSRRPAI
jgi:NAD(P)-dependent dehydrogenase (short-subunit alcohol dehydrogenase family)